jgi:hypothetical protein
MSRLAEKHHEPPLAASSFVTLARDVVFSEIDRDVVALNVERGLCYGLEGSGARIWRMIAEGIKVQELCRTLAAEYCVDVSTCKSDVMALLDEMRAEGLIEIVAEAPQTV